MDAKELVSVIVPVYKTEKYIDRCVQSIINQTYTNFELILVDDGSPDKAGKICDSYAEQDKRIQCVHIPNGGVSNARNMGITKAIGQYIVFVDSDDWIKQDHLENLFSVASKGGLGACGIISCHDEEKTNILVLSKDESEISVFASSGIGGFPVNKIYDRSVIEEYQLRFDSRFNMCEDLLFNIQYIYYMPADTIRWSQKQTYYYETTVGATRGRFQKGHQYSEKDLSEYLAVLETKKYCAAPNVLKACDARLTKAAVNTLRVLAAGNHINSEEYNTILSYVRKHLAASFQSSSLAKSSKLSILLSAISPRLELMVYLKRNSKIMHL